MQRKSLPATLAIGLGVALGGVAHTSVPNEKQPTVRWQRKVFTADACPAEMPTATRETIEHWSGWAGEYGYRMDLDPNSRVLLLSADRRRSVHRQTELVKKTLETFDEVTPWVEPSAENRGDVVVPRTGPRHDAPIVLFHLQDQEDLAGAVEALAADEPYLAEWVDSAKQAPGFVLERPFVAGFIDNPGIEEWRPQNELVNRLSHVLALARFGRLPHWLAEGMAWHIELEVTRSIYAFPGRVGFVAISEHKGWTKALHKLYRKRRDASVDVEELTSWERGTYDDTFAAISWGVVTFLAKHRPGTLSGIAADLGLYREMHGVTHHANGTWELVPHYEVPTDVQRTVILRHATVSTLAECMRFFQKGRRYRPR
ncbi:MAG: hypothetical protein GY711_35315 [bacterium]|nr:hypothetical protein [bacterium]